MVSCDYDDWPYEVHEGVGGCDISPLGQISLVTQVFLPSPWPDHDHNELIVLHYYHDDDDDHNVPDGDNEDDAKNDGKDSCDKIVDNCPYSNLSYHICLFPEIELIWWILFIIFLRIIFVWVNLARKWKVHGANGRNERRNDLVEVLKVWWIWKMLVVRLASPNCIFRYDRIS